MISYFSVLSMLRFLPSLAKLKLFNGRTFLILVIVLLNSA